MTTQRPKTTRQDPLDHRRPAARGDERGRLPRLHAVVPVPALPLGQLRAGGEEGTWDGLSRPERRSATADGRRWRSGTRRTRRRGGLREADAPQGALRHQARAPLGQHRPHGPHAGRRTAQHAAEGLQVHRERVVPEHLPGAVLGDQPRLGQARARPTPTATPSSARSSPRSPRGWRSSRPTATRWATPTNT